MELLNKIREYRTFRRTVRDLSHLSNGQLEDIGIPRWRVRDVARGGRIDPGQVV